MVVVVVVEDSLSLLSPSSLSSNEQSLSELEWMNQALPSFYLLMWSKCLFRGFTMARVASFPTLAGLWCVLSNIANPPTTYLIYLVISISFSYLHERIHGWIRCNGVRNRKMGCIGVKRRRRVVRMRHEIPASFLPLGSAWLTLVFLFLIAPMSSTGKRSCSNHTPFNFQSLMESH